LPEEKASTIDQESEVEITDPEKLMATYKDYMGTVVESFFSPMFSNGIIDEVDMDQLKKYFANPDDYQKELENLAEYYYISNGEIFQLFELTSTLPPLNYKIEAFNKPKNYQTHADKLNQILYQVHHKTLTRDIIRQEISAGTLVGIWLGKDKNIYPYLFDDLNYIFPMYRKNGQWQAVVDMGWFDTLTDTRKKIEFTNLKPYIKESDYENYKQDKEQYQYVELPQDRTFILRTHALKRNQRLGTNWSTTGLYDVLHKKKLKDLEKAIANKVINAIVVLTIGNEDGKDSPYANLKLNKNLKRKIHSGVKTALETNSKDAVSVVTIPEFAKLDFPDLNTGEGLKPDKFESINADITSSFGLGSAVMNGTGANYNSAKLNSDAFYRRIGVLLEEIEYEVYQKLFNLVLPSAQSNNFIMVYDKEAPLSSKDKIDALFKLEAQGFAVKPIVDLLDGVSFDSFIDDTLYEQNVLKLKDVIRPYQNTNTLTNNGNDTGRPPDTGTDVTNENTNKSKTNG
jgi:hypothetical protein